MSNGKPTILQIFYDATASTGPYILPAPASTLWPDGSTRTSVLLRLTPDMDGANHVYKTVTYLVGPGATSTSVTLSAATTYCVLVDLPDGIATPLADLAALFPKPAAAAAAPLTNPPPPPAPGTIHGGNMM